jgi:hypothetical protein
MSRILGSAVLLLVTVWIIALVLYLGPVRDAAEVTLTWLAWAAAASAAVAALTMFAFGLLLGRTSPSWLRVVRLSRTVAAVLGSVLIAVGLLHYRDTEPHGDIQWLVLGLAVLIAAGVVHWWVVLTARRFS